MLLELKEIITSFNRHWIRFNQVSMSTKIFILQSFFRKYQWNICSLFKYHRFYTSVPSKQTGMSPTSACSSSFLGRLSPWKCIDLSFRFYLSVDFFINLFFYLYDWCFAQRSRIFALYDRSQHYDERILGSDLGNPRPSTGCWQASPLTAGERHSMSWAETLSDRMGERLLCHWAGLKR